MRNAEQTVETLKVANAVMNEDQADSPQSDIYLFFSLHSSRHWQEKGTIT